ncbi:MAG: gliding motility-associated C-terminal domain-containing protein [Candidatus Cloacimonetes bacterium]|nr:gliding motility-associated C-terminal domain-containing protein [Candidatus Cloacimonadota bacterium]
MHKELQKMVRIKVYNLRGQIVKTLGLMVNGKGEYQIVWDGRDMRGKLQPSGIYFYVIDFGDAQLSGRMVMSK